MGGAGTVSVWKAASSLGAGAGAWEVAVPEVGLVGRGEYQRRVSGTRVGCSAFAAAVGGRGVASAAVGRAGVGRVSAVGSDVYPVVFDAVSACLGAARVAVF